MDEVYTISRDNHPPPENISLPPSHLRFARNAWSGVGFGPASLLLGDVHSRTADIAKLHWACREASLVWTRAISSGKIDDALPPRFEPKHTQPRTRREQKQNDHGRKAALELSLYAAIADNALEINLWHRGVRRIYNVLYETYEDWLHGRWGAYHSPIEAEKFAHDTLLRVFPKEQFILHGHVRMEGKDFAVEALNIVWERLVDCTQPQALPADYLDMTIVAPWLPREEDWPLERWVVGVSVDELAEGHTVRSAEVIYYDVRGREVSQPSLEQMEAMEHWERKYQRTFVDDGGSSRAPAYDIWLKSRRDG